MAVANIPSCITLGGSWNLDRHTGWYVSNFVRRPLSVSAAVGSPVHSSDETTLLPLASDTTTSSNPPEKYMGISLQGFRHDGRVSPKGQQSPAVSFLTDAVCSMNRVCTANRTHTIHRGSGTGSRRTTNHVSGTRPDTTTFLC